MQVPDRDPCVRVSHAADPRIRDRIDYNFRRVADDCALEMPTEEADLAVLIQIGEHGVRVFINLPTLVMGDVPIRESSSSMPSFS